MNQNNVQQLPIDIHANKLLEWLISRKHCTNNWPEKIGFIREKINAAILDMPEHPKITKILLEASPINYFHCLRIVDVLKETEAESKNFFGMYGSRRMKDWQEILKLYQRDNLYLAESSSIYARNVIYEVPAMKRLTTKLESLKNESIKREGNFKKLVQENRDKFYFSCNQLGLSISSDDKEPTISYLGKLIVNQMTQELPKIFNDISLKSKNIIEAVNFYKRFVKETIGDKHEELILLSFFIERGNVTTYEYRYGEAPIKIEHSAKEEFAVEETADVNVDDGQIDFGIDLDTNDIQLETGDIDWGDIGVVVEEQNFDDQIDFSVVDDTNTGIVVEEAGIEGGVARDREALTLLENSDTRGQFVDELYELEGFLSQRLEELKNAKPNEISLTIQEESLPKEKICELLASTNAVLSFFKEVKTKQYLTVFDSKRFVTRLAESLLQNFKLANKMQVSYEMSVNKTKQITEEMEQLRPKIVILTKQSKELQEKITKELASRYNNRQVFLSGGL